MVPLAIAAIAAGTIVATGGAATPAAAPALGAGLGAGVGSGVGVAGAGAASGGFASTAQWLLGGSMGLSAIGSLSQANAAGAAGKAQEANQKFIAAQLDQRAGQERAASQRQAAEIARQGRFAQSRALALGAASGGGVSNAGFMDIVGDLQREIEVRKSTILAEGEDTAIGLETSAEARRRSGIYDNQAGQQRKTQTLVGGASDAALGGATLFGRYG